MYRFSEENHLHEICKNGDWKPLMGTSTVIDVLSKPLTWWAVGLALQKLGWIKIKCKPGEIPLTVKKRAKELGLEFKKAGMGYVYIPEQIRVEFVEPMLRVINLMTPKEFLKLLDEAYYAHSQNLKDTAQDGKDLHSLAEQWVKGQISGTPVTPDKSIAPLVKWAQKNVKKWLWSEMHCFSETYWIGGISDAGFVDMNDRVGIMDFKSSKDAYPSQFIQEAGYDIQISENGGFDREGNKVFDLEGRKVEIYAILPFGMKNAEPQIRYNVEEQRVGFVSAVNLYKLVNN